MGSVVRFLTIENNSGAEIQHHFMHCLWRRECKAAYTLANILLKNTMFDVCVISIKFANYLQKVPCEPSPISFFNSRTISKKFLANHLQSVFSTNTMDIRSSVGTVFIRIFVLSHVCRKISLCRQQFSRNCW